MKQEEHAARIWPMLVSAAMNRQTLTYERVGDAVGVPARGLAEILGHIMLYCYERGLPPLTVLVVSKDTGKPGAGLGTSDDFDVDREKIYRFAWIDHAAPRAEELKPFAPRSQKTT